jgi:lipoprotein signal peptidase
VEALAIAGVLAVTVVALDQRLKTFVLARPGTATVLTPRVWAGASPLLPLLWAACAATVAAGAAAGVLPAAAAVALAIAAAGAASNLIDLRRRGAVVDHISIGWWPAFNLADAAITVGTVAALAVMLV